MWLKKITPSSPQSHSAVEVSKKLIQDGINKKLIPMVEMHDATCDLSQLNTAVAYGTRADVVALVQKYERAFVDQRCQ